MGSYAEGIDLFYTTNTFHISGDILLTRLPDYIVPTRLAQMTSFEIVLPVSGDMRQEPFRPWSATLVPLLKMLAQSTGVKRLYLCLPCPQIWGRIIDVDLALILDAMDDFVRLSKAESTILQMNPSSLSSLAEGVSVLDEGIDHPTQKGYTHQMWRCLDEEAGQATIHKRKCFYPFAPVAVKDVPDQGQRLGYWIVKSIDWTTFGPLMFS